jgi:DNA-binding response OmpR family regulator
MGEDPGEKFHQPQGLSGESPKSGSPQAEPRTPNVLLVDDDAVFGRILSRVAEQSRTRLTCCRSLDELGEKDWHDFDAAIVDFDLGTATGLEVIRQMEKFGSLPIILVSHGREVDIPISLWPHSIKGFIHKSLGPFAIMEAAVAAYTYRSNGSSQRHKGPSSPPEGRSHVG